MIVQDQHTALPPLITSKEAAQLANCSMNHITNLCRAGKIKAVRIGKKHWRISTAEFMAYLGITA